MAPNVTIIGRVTRVRGRLTGAADLEVQGFVEGEIAVSGDVTIDTTGMVGAGVRGRRLVVRGAVKGDLVGEEAVLLEEGSRVVGDVRAPRVAIAPGALVRGYVETGQSSEQHSPARRAQAQVSDGGQERFGRRSGPRCRCSTRRKASRAGRACRRRLLEWPSSGKVDESQHPAPTSAADRACA